MYNIGLVCADALAGASQFLPASIARNSKKYFEKATADKINTFVFNNFGATFGVLAYKALTLIDRSPLHHKYLVAVSLAVAAAGTLYTRNRILAEEGKELTQEQDHNLTVILVSQLVANGVLGAIGLFRGEYTFGAVALFCSFSNILPSNPIANLKF